MQYLLIPFVCIFTIYVIFLFAPDYNRKIANSGLLLLIIFSFIILGFVIYYQEISGDAYRYSLQFFKYTNLNFTQLLNSNGDFLFKLLNWIVGDFTRNPRVLFLIIFLIYIGIFYISVSKLFSIPDKYYILSIYILYTFFIFYMINAKRQGLSLVFLFLSLSFLVKKEYYKSFIFLIVSILFHKATLLTVPYFIMIVLIKNRNKLMKFSLIIYIVSLLLSILNLNKKILSPIKNFLIHDKEHYIYFSQDFIQRVNYHIGFRIDFTLFSILPLIVFFILKKNINDYFKDKILLWLSIYILFNSIYNFFSFLPFSDRFAIFSWFLWPLVLYYIFKAINDKLLILYILFFIIINLILLQFYTGKAFKPIEGVI